MDADCHRNAGTQLEKALNFYISAYNACNTCVENATTCDEDKNTTTLQGHWANATAEMAKVKAVWP